MKRGPLRSILHRLPFWLLGIEGVYLFFFSAQYNGLSVYFNQQATEAKTTRRAHHILDCDGEGSACAYFYPTEFFESPSGLGYKHRAAAQQQLYGHATRTFDANWIRARNRYKQRNETAYPPNDFTYIHVRKAGGMTMKQTFWKFPYREVGTNYTSDPIYTAKSRYRLEQVGEEAFVSEMKELAESTLFFTFVRDPFSRFLSAMGQFASRILSYAELDCPELKHLNTSDVRTYAQQEIRCVLRSKKKGIEVDEHFVLATHEMYQMMFGTNAKVAVLPLANITDFMATLQVYNLQVNVARGVKLKYKNVDILEGDMIRDICEIYEPDVQMLRTVGIPVPQCDEHVPIVPAKQ